MAKKLMLVVIDGDDICVRACGVFDTEEQVRDALVDYDIAQQRGEEEKVRVDKTMSLSEVKRRIEDEYFDISVIAVDAGLFSTVGMYRVEGLPMATFVV